MRRFRRAFFSWPVITALLLLAGSLLLPILPAAGADETGVPLPPQVEESIKSALLMDGRTGQVFYAYQENTRLQPASLAKLLTFDLVLEALEKGEIRLSDQATVSEAAWRLSVDQSVSHMFLEIGEKVTVEDLLYGLMVSSGNDAGLVLAEFLAGSEEAFVEQMNARARELGLTDTHLQNPHGLEAPDQYTTAKDMGILARHLVTAHPEATKYTSAKEFTHAGILQYNWNKLLFRDPRVNGLKTGHLASGGYNLVATAREGETYLVAVVMGAPNDNVRTDVAGRLLDWGFNNLTTIAVPSPAIPSELPVYKGKTGRVAVQMQGDLLVTVTKEAAAGLSAQAQVEELVVAPVKAGTKVGEITITGQAGPLKTVPLVAAADVEKGGFFRTAWDSIRLFFRRIF